MLGLCVNYYMVLPSGHSLERGGREVTKQLHCNEAGAEQKYTQSDGAVREGAPLPPKIDLASQRR